MFSILDDIPGETKGENRGDTVHYIKTTTNPSRYKFHKLKSTRKEITEYQNTHTLGSETLNIPCSARYGSFSFSSSRFTYSGPEAG